MREFDEMKLARVVDACEGIDGRVKMQKIVYLLKSMGYDLPFDDFTIRQHGPFSRAVACSTDVLKAAEIIIEQCEDFGNQPGGEPVRQYSYRVRSDITPLIRAHFDIPAPKDRPSLDEAGKLLVEHDRAVLELAATRLFLERESGLSGEDLEQSLRSLKGHLASRFNDADRLLSNLSDRGWLN
ncbi:MAG: hypothetical protein HY718_16555 [Planctomycetes bacterium]|nr:hypothetical protein [Planctomycetota bacterium]